MSLKLSAVLICLRYILCFEAKFMLTPQEIENSLEENSELSQRFGIVPGTKWCGPGSTASFYNDLGHLREVDICCRDHDNCDNIPAGETKHNLTNRNKFTVLDCDCDQKFRQCLKKIDSKASNGLGVVYFKVQNRCYHYDYPYVRCSRYNGPRCIQYVFDKSKPKRYQWFDLPFYDGNSERDAIDDYIYDF